jgi:hypothetical protein
VELAKRKFINFVTYTKKDYEVNWHHDLLASYLDRFASGDIKKLMVFMPPQHGKSELTSRRLPAYLLGINPKLKIVGCSYSADLAKSFNRDVQRIIDEPVYKNVFPQTKLNQTNVKTIAGSYLRNSDIFETIEHRGFYKSVGVGGGLTGTSVDIAIIDDPVKDAIEGNSLTDQSRKWEWYTNVLLTRLHNDSQQLITMTRWHKEDLCGKILNKMPQGWEVLKLEAIKQNNTHEADVRQYGEALWESKHSKEKIMNIAKANPRTFNALYQGDPKPNKIMQYCSTFSYPKHVKKVEYNYNLPLHYSVDFNTQPYMSGLVIQLEYIKDGFWNNLEEYWQVNIIDQLALQSPNNTAKALGSFLEAKYPQIETGFFLYGDASGNYNTGISTTSTSLKTKTLFSDLLQGLSKSSKLNVQKRIPSKNPSYRSIGQGMLGRRVFLNELFQSTLPVRILINPNCIELIKDLEECTQDVNGKLAKPKNKEGYEPRGHMLQALEYFFCHPKSIGYLAKIKK